MEYSYQEIDLPFTVWHNGINSRFSRILKHKWDELHSVTDVFRYSISNVKERIVNQKYLLMLNPERGYNRRQAEEFRTVLQEFDPLKFNFTKVTKNELLFKINEKHVILINVSPISRYHSLFCPSIDNCLPQVATAESIKLVMELLFLCQDRDLRIGFNSLCGLASVNHLHYHLMFEKFTLPCEVAKGTIIAGRIFHLYDNMVPAFCFQLLNKNEIYETSKDVSKLLSYLIEKNIAHNMLITRGQNLIENSIDLDIVRVIIWPRRSCFGVKQYSAFNIAVCELSGWFPVFNERDFQDLNIVDLEKELKSWKFEQFSELLKNIKELFS